MRKQTIGVIELLLTALIWGVAFVAQSVGMKYIGPHTFNCVRFLIGGLVLIPIVFFFRKGKKQEICNKKTLIGGICCGICLCFASTFQQLGIQHTTVGKAGFITALYIVIVPVLGIFMRKKITLITGISALIAVTGFYFLCISGKVTIGKGDVLLLICALLFSLHIMVIDYFSGEADGVVMSCIQFLVSGVISGIFMFATENPQISSLVSAWQPILYAGLMSCGVAYTLQIIGQKHVEPALASLIMSLESVFSVLAGWLLLQQKLSMRELLGCALVFGAVILAQIPVPAKEKE